MTGWHHQLYGHEFEWTPGDGDGQGGLAYCDSCGHKESDMTERLNWTDWEQGCAVLCLVSHSCPTLCDPMDFSPPGFLVYGDSPGKNTGVDCHALLQGIFLTQGSNPGLLHCRWILYRLSHQGSPRILEWVAYPFSGGSSQSRNRTGSPALEADSLPAELPGKPRMGLHFPKS